MKLYRVTVFAKKEGWVENIKLQWAVISNTSDNAIKKILDKFDLSGVIIEKITAEEEDYIMIK